MYRGVWSSFPGTGILAVGLSLFSAPPPVEAQPAPVSPVKAAQDHVARGHRALKAGNLREGCFQYTSAVRVLPNWWIPYEEYIRCSRLLGKEPRVLIGELEHILTVDPQRHSLHTLLGSLHEDSGDAQSANRAYRRALEIAPWYVPATLALGRSLGASRLHQEAYEALVRALELRPGNLQLQMGLAEACIATGRKIEAIRILEEVAPVSNRPSAIYAKLARLYLEVRNPRGRNQALSRLRQYK